MMLGRARLLVATFWVGSLWAVGYMAAPTLFATLADRALAGVIAGSIFRVEAWVSLACGALLLAMLVGRELDPAKRRSLQIWVIAMLACTLIGYFGLQPQMAALKGAAGVVAVEAKTQFAWLHGIASSIYLVQSLLGAGLILKIR